MDTEIFNRILSRAYMLSDQLRDELRGLLISSEGSLNAVVLIALRNHELTKRILETMEISGGSKTFDSQEMLEILREDGIQ